MTLDKQFKAYCGGLGGYETDFMYICSFLVAFAAPMKDPQWTFVGLRSALNSFGHVPMLRDIMRRCFVLAGRSVIAGIEDPTDKRMDRAFYRLLQDKEFEYTVMLEPHLGALVEEEENITFSFLPQSVDNRTRLVRFLMQCVFDNQHSSLYQIQSPPDSIMGLDRNGRSYCVITDTSFEIGCWKEVDDFGTVELLATDTEGLANVIAGLKSNLFISDNEKSSFIYGNCVYCTKKTSNSSDQVICIGCGKGACHYRCIPSSALNGFQWVCGSICNEVCMISKLSKFLNEFEPIQKAAMRKRRRMANEIHSLQITANNLTGEETNNSRSTRRGRPTSSVDYSFRDYDKAMNDAIRKSERKSEESMWEEELVTSRENHRSVPLSRDERMALRHNRQTSSSLDSGYTPELSHGQINEHFVTQEYVSNDAEFLTDSVSEGVYAKEPSIANGERTFQQ